MRKLTSEEKASVRADTRKMIEAQVLGRWDGPNAPGNEPLPFMVWNMLDEIETLLDRARRFKGWRIRYELQRADTSWGNVARLPQNDLRCVFESARWLRQKSLVHIRNVRVMRVFRKARGTKQVPQ